MHHTEEQQKIQDELKTSTFWRQKYYSPATEEGSRSI
jgi:hypothetical protein